MPLTPKGHRIMASMKKEYGEKKGEEVFYASKNAGKLKGVDSDDELSELELAKSKKRPITLAKLDAALSHLDKYFD